MVMNPNGAVVMADGGAPRIITGYAREVISGGMFVAASGGAVDGSTYCTGSILFHNGASGAEFNGIALNTAASGAEIAVATRGTFIVPTDATVLAGYLLRCDGQQVQQIGSVAANLTSTQIIGRSLTAGASGGFVLMDIHG
jgi:hypothetical protein